jgi:hypothetical protein
MKPVALLPAIFLAAACAAAQYTPPNQNQGGSISGGVAGMEGLSTDSKLTAQAATDLQHAINICPISMEARQGGGLRVERAQDGKGPSSPFMTPSLTLHNPKDKRILYASVTALGSGPNKGALLLQARERKQNDDNPPDEFLERAPNQDSSAPPFLRRTLTVHFQPDDNNTVSGSLYLPGFVILHSIALNSVTFADGSTQSFASVSSCRVQPSPLMLVNATK